jgi:glycosyltransferase involved in cell wall biosynthesis
MGELDPQLFDSTAMDEGLWIVMAAYNEAGVIAATLAELGRLYRNVVVVSDGSTDDTVHQAVAGGAVVLSHAINLGQGAALQTGIDYALSRGAKLVCTFDADGQHRVCDIAELLERLRQENADIAFGSRFLGGTVNMPLRRKIVLKLGAIFNFLTTGILMTDAHNGLRVMTADAARKIRIRQNGMAHASEIVEQVARLKLKFVEVPVVVIYSQYSKAKGQALGNSVNIALDVIGRKVQR